MDSELLIRESDGVLNSMVLFCTFCCEYSLQSSQLAYNAVESELIPFSNDKF